MVIIKLLEVFQQMPGEVFSEDEKFNNTPFFAIKIVYAEKEPDFLIIRKFVIREKINLQMDN